MIKRRFYNQEHAGNSDESDSSSSDSELEAEPDQDSDFEDHAMPETNAPNRSSSSSSGYKSEDGSENEVDVDSSAVYNQITEGNAETLGSHHTLRAEISADRANCILKFKSVFKCRLCPRILCLNQGSVRTLSSISAPPAELLAVFGIVFLFLGFSLYTSYRAQMHRTFISLRLVLFLLPVLLIFLMRLADLSSCRWLIRLMCVKVPGMARRRLFRKAQTGGGGSPWVVALLLLLLMVMVYFQSSFHNNWFRPLWRFD